MSQKLSEIIIDEWRKSQKGLNIDMKNVTGVPDEIYEHINYYTNSREWRMIRAKNIAEKKDQKIPNIIHQTYPYRLLPKNLWEKVMTWRRMNPSYSHVIYDNKDIDVFIHNLKNDNLTKLFNSINISYIKSIIFRYIVLYNIGGIFCDIDISCKEKINWIDKNDTVVSFEHNDRNIIAVAPKNRMIRDSLNEILNMIERRELNKKLTEVLNINILSNKILNINDYVIVDNNIKESYILPYYWKNTIKHNPIYCQKEDSIFIWKKYKTNINLEKTEAFIPCLNENKEKIAICRIPYRLNNNEDRYGYIIGEYHDENNYGFGLLDGKKIYQHHNVDLLCIKDRKKEHQCYWKSITLDDLKNVCHLCDYPDTRRIYITKININKELNIGSIGYYIEGEKKFSEFYIKRSPVVMSSFDLLYEELIECNGT